MIVYQSTATGEILVCDNDDETLLLKLYFEDSRQRDLRDYFRFEQRVLSVRAKFDVGI